MSAAGWDAAMTHELRRVYFEAMRDAVIDGAPLLAAHDDGLRAIATHAIAVERATINDESRPSF